MAKKKTIEESAKAGVEKMNEIVDSTILKKDTEETIEETIEETPIAKKMTEAEPLEVVNLKEQEEKQQKRTELIDTLNGKQFMFEEKVVGTLYINADITYFSPEPGFEFQCWKTPEGEIATEINTIETDSFFDEELIPSYKEIEIDVEEELIDEDMSAEEEMEFLIDEKFRPLLKSENYYNHIAPGRFIKNGNLTVETLQSFFEEFISYGISSKTDSLLIKNYKKYIK